MRAGAPKDTPARQSGTVPGRLPARPFHLLECRAPGGEVSPLHVALGQDEWAYWA